MKTATDTNASAITKLNSDLGRFHFYSTQIKDNYTNIISLPSQNTSYILCVHHGFAGDWRYYVFIAYNKLQINSIEGSNTSNNVIVSATTDNKLLIVTKELGGNLTANLMSIGLGF